MAINGSPEYSVSSKAQEAKKPLKKRAGKKEVQGFYYHAAEYQRARQKERNGFVRILSGVAEPFMIHVRAARLRAESSRKRGFGNATVLDNDITKKLLEGKMSEKDIQQFRTKSQARTVLGKYDVGTEEDRLAAQSMVSNIFEKKGNLSDADRALYEKEIDKKDLDKLLKDAQENASAYTTVEEIKQLSESVTHDNLTKEQQEMADKLAKAAWANSILTALNYGKTALVVSFLASNPVGWAATAAITIGSAGFSGATRGTRLLKEMHTHDISKSKGLDVAHKVTGLERIFGVDWDEDPANRPAQILRASAAGALVALGARFLPTLLEHGGDVFHSGVNEVQNLAGQATGAAQHGADNLHGLVVVNPDHTQVPIANLHENIHDPGIAQETRIHYLPDTKHHDWQQLHTYTQEVKGADGKVLLDSSGKPLHEIKLSYMGQDDGIPHDQHYVDIMLDKGHHVFIQNDSVLAFNGPDADKLINIYDAPGHVVGQIHSINLAHEMGLSQGKIDHFADLSKAAHEHLWHGTQDASDLQTIMPHRGLYNNGDAGNYLWGYRLGGGYFKGGVFQVGASNHYWNPGLAHTDVLKTDFPTGVGHPEPEEFRSVLAPVLRPIDNGEDWLINAMKGNIFSDSFSQHLDDFTDFGLNNTDNLVFMAQEKPWLAPFYLSPFAATGIVGYAYGRRRALEGKLPAWEKVVGRTGLAALVWALPGAAATAALGNVIARLQYRNGGKKASEETKTAPQPTPQPTPQPASDTPVADTAVAATAVAATPEANEALSATAPVEEEQTELNPAPIPGTDTTTVTTPLVTEALETTAPVDEETALPPTNETTETVPSETQPILLATDVIREVNQYKHADAVNNLFELLNSGEVSGALLAERLEDLRLANQRDAFLIPQDDQFLQQILTEYASNASTEEENANATLSAEQVANVEQTLRAILPVNKNQVQLVRDAQQVLDLDIPEEDKEKLSESFAALPAGRVLQRLEKAKRADALLSPDAFLPMAIVAASVVNWNQGDQPAEEQELGVGDFQAISQVVYGDSTDEHTLQVREAYEKYLAQQEAPAVEPTEPAGPAEKAEEAEVPVETDSINVPEVAAVVATSDELHDVHPFTELTSNAPEEEKEATFKNELENMGAERILETLLSPIAKRLDIPQEKLDAGINEFLKRAGKLERVGALILLATTLYKLAENSEGVKSLLGNIMTTVRQKVGANASREEIVEGIKSVLAEEGKEGAELAALGDDALPVIEDIAPLLT
ncbi:MAG TPA: hypothetical protein VEW42_03440 [Candidatus Eisenbacteria bacterium]|nr:hypothetical protein [Candidatus Eisenbacteria bacterium]